MVERKKIEFETQKIPLLPGGSAQIGANIGAANDALNLKALTGIKSDLEAISKAEEAEALARTQALSKAITDTVELETTGGLNTLASENEFDPGEVLANGEKIITQNSLRIPLGQRAAFVQSHRNALNLKVNEINNAVTKESRAEATANHNLLLALEKPALKKGATNLWSKDPAKRKAAQDATQSLLDKRAHRLLETRPDFRGDPQILHSKKDQAEDAVDALRMAFGSATKGWVGEQGSMALGIRAVQQGELTAKIPDPRNPGELMEVPIIDFLGDDWTRIKTELTDQLTADNRVKSLFKEQLGQMEKRESRARYDEALLAITDPGGELVAPTTKEILESPPFLYGTEKGAKSSLIKAISDMEQEAKGIIKVDDVNEVLFLDAMLNNDLTITDQLEAIRLGDSDAEITQKTFLSLSRRNSALIDASNGKLVSKFDSLVKEEKKKLRNFYTDNSHRMAAFDVNGARKLNQALDEYDEAIKTHVEENGLKGIEDFLKAERLQLESRRTIDRKDRARDILPVPLGMGETDIIDSVNIEKGLKKLIGLQLDPASDRYRQAIKEYGILSEVVDAREGLDERNNTELQSGRGLGALK